MKVINYLGVLVWALAAFTTALPSSKENLKRLIKTSETQPAVWLTEDEIFSLIDRNINFIDITGRTYPKINPNAPRRAFPTTLRFNSTVRESFTKLSAARTETFMVGFTSFYNRYYTSEWGVNASNWLLTQIQDSIASIGYAGDARASLYGHSWPQSSVVARIWGSDPALSGEVVVLGAHLDSVVSGGNGSVNNFSPGGDDNASGSAALLETFRALLESGFIPKRTIEFQWYAAEEVGLRGSGDIAEAYNRLGVNVISMMNFDVVGYYSPGRTDIRFVNDNTDNLLNQFLQLIVEEYLGVTWYERGCGYGCSDHASWNTYGFSSSSPMEPVGSPNMHTIRDTLDTVSYDQVVQFAKLALGYCIESAEPN